MALAGQPGGITVSTLAEAEYFANHGIIPAKLDRMAALHQAGADVLVIRSSRPAPPRV